MRSDELETDAATEDEEEVPGGFAALLCALAGAALGVVVFSLIVQILGRTVLVRPLAWAGELARFAAVYAALLSAAAAFQMAALHRVEVLVDRLPALGVRITRTIANLMILALLLYLIWYGVEMVQRTLVQRSSVMLVPMGWIYAAVPLSAAFMLVTLALTFRTERHR